MRYLVQYCGVFKIKTEIKIIAVFSNGIVFPGWNFDIGFMFFYPFNQWLFIRPM